MCKRTFLAPRYGNPVSEMIAMRRFGENLPNQFAFKTSHRVIGIVSLPLTGDPSQVISTICFSFKYLFL